MKQFVPLRTPPTTDLSFECCLTNFYLVILFVHVNIIFSVSIFVVLLLLMMLVEYENYTNEFAYSSDGFDLSI